MLIAYEFATVAVPALVACIAVYSHDRRASGRGDGRPGGGWVVSVAAFVVYLFALLHYTNAGTLHDVLHFGLDLESQRIAVVPFADARWDVDGHILNIALFVPFGLLVSLLLPDAQGNGSPGKVLASSAFISLLIELSQLLNRRVTDVDDLITNVLGAVIGCALFALLPRGFVDKARAGLPRGIVPACVVAAFLGRFLLYDELAAALVLFG